MESDRAVNNGSNPGSPRGLGLAFGLSQLAYSIAFLALLSVLAAPRAPTVSLAPHRTPTGDSTTAAGTSTVGVRWLRVEPGEGRVALSWSQDLIPIRMPCVRGDGGATTAHHGVRVALVLE